MRKKRKRIRITKKKLNRNKPKDSSLDVEIRVRKSVTRKIRSCPPQYRNQLVNQIQTETNKGFIELFGL